MDGGERGGEFWLGVMNELNAGRSGCVDRGGGRAEGVPGGDRGGVSGGDGADVPVHLIRYSLAHASWKERKELAGALRPIYQADTADEAAEALFEAGPWGRKFPARAELATELGAGDPVLRVFEADPAGDLHDERDREPEQPVRRAVRTRGHFPNERAAMKLIYLTLRRSRGSGSGRRRFGPARAEFAIVFGDRFPVERF